MRIKVFTVAMLLLLTGAASLKAQQKVVPLAFGDFERWTVREIKESSVIGGKTRRLYEIAPNDTIRGEIPYKSTKSPWGTSNVLAKVSGVVKCSSTVFPDTHNGGRCARLETRLENVKVLGIINISVLASGSIFLGELDEPITSTNNPNSKLLMGVPFTGRPSAVMLDYKMKASGDANRVKVTGFSPRSTVPGRDHAVLNLFLQKRWEDADGNLYAKRIGTATEKFMETTHDWIDAHKVKVHYGDFSSDPDASELTGLIPESKSYYARNSKGQIVPIKEVGWADAGEKPTHMILMISSSYDEAYIGSIGNCFWVDNIKLIY